MKTLIFTSLLLTFCLVVNAQQLDTTEAYKSKIKQGLLLSFNQKLPINEQYGISVGLIEEFRFTKKIFLQPQILLTILPYKIAGKKEISKILEIPLHLQLKPFNCKNNPTISIGPNYKHDFNNVVTGLYCDLAF